MSKEYEIHFYIAGFKEDKAKLLAEEIQKLWTIDTDTIDTINFWCDVHNLIDSDNTKLPETYLYCNGIYSLFGGESEDEFFERVQETIWKYNEAYCYVEIHTLCTEDLPYNQYCTSPCSYMGYRAGVK